MKDWEKDKIWADRYLPEIRRVIKLNAGENVDIDIAPDEEDRTCATDYKIKVKTGDGDIACDIACRVRKLGCKYRDLTLRHARISGVITELEKIKAGYADWYLYAWVSNNKTFDDWIFVDLNKLRSSGLLDKERPVILNLDGKSDFIGISFQELKLNACIVDFEAASAVGKMMMVRPC